MRAILQSLEFFLSKLRKPKLQRLYGRQNLVNVQILFPYRSLPLPQKSFREKHSLPIFLRRWIGNKLAQADEVSVHLICALLNRESETW